MNSTAEGNKKISTSKIIFWSVFVITLICRIYKITTPITNNCEHSFRTSQTAIVVQDFFRNGFSFLNSSIPVFGAPWRTMFEFPTYQAIVFFIMKIFGASDIDLFCRIISILIFYACTWAIMKLAKLLSDESAAFATGIVMLTMVYNIYWSRQALIDYLSAFLGIVYIWCLYSWLDNKKRYVMYVIGLAMGMLGFLTKAASMFPVVFFIAYFILEHEIKLCLSEEEDSIPAKVKRYFKENILRLAGLALITLLPASMAVIWTRYIDATKKLSPYTTWLSSEYLYDWNYGPLKERLDLLCWGTISERYFNLFGGIIVFLIIVILYLRTERKYLKQIIVAFAAQFLTVLVMFNLYYVHSYYLIVLTPFACYAFGMMLTEICTYICAKEKQATAKLTICFGALLIFQVIVNTDYAANIFFADTANNNIGCYIKTITDYDELIVIANEDWSPSTLYNADRRGFMIQADTAVDEKLHEYLREDNYTTFVSHGLDNTNEFLKEYPYVVQYPFEIGSKIDGANVSFIYKYGDLPIKSHNEDVKLLNLEYTTTGNTKAVIRITDNDGTIHECEILLLEDRNNISIDISDISSDAKSVQMYLNKSNPIDIAY